MIERYTIKFTPAVSQKDLEKALNGGEDEFHPEDLTKIKARIELIGDVADLKELSATIKRLAKDH